jgi:hypothetical protein
MKRFLSVISNCRLAAVALLALLLTSAAGCCHCRIAGVPTPATLSPMMKDVARWFQQRELSYTTNEIGGEMTFRAIFADQPGEEPSCAWTVATNSEKDLLTIHTVFSPAISPGMETLAFVWLTSANSESPWGFYGFDAQESQLWFRISLFRANQHVEASEMDRLLLETMTAMGKARKLLTNGDDTEKESEDPKQPANESEASRANFYLLKSRSWAHPVIIGTNCISLRIAHPFIRS